MAKVINKVASTSKVVELGDIVKGKLSGSHYMVTKDTEGKYFLLKLETNILYLNSNSLAHLQSRLNSGYEITGIKAKQVTVTFN